MYGIGLQVYLYCGFVRVRPDTMLLILYYYFVYMTHI